MVDLRSLTLPEMTEFVKSLGEPAFRAKQVFGWIYKGITDFRGMKNLPEVFRLKLSEVSCIGRLEVLDEQVSKSDGTRKFLFGLEDGNAVESVFMKYRYGNSICLSSQAGCRMGCRFCASTRAGLVRNLTAGEMVSQLMEAEAATGEKINHIVVMGTGEPFDNYENLAGFIRIVTDPAGRGMSMRNITVSTCGIAPVIERFGEDFPQVNLAVSLHGATDGVRGSMMPVNGKWPVAELISACRDYTEKTRRRITFEYTLVNGVNDSDGDAEKLCRLLRGMLCHVNLIPLNRVDGTGFDTVSRKRAAEFKEILENAGVPATVRRELGADIDGACGQLRLNNIKRSGANN